MKTRPNPNPSTRAVPRRTWRRSTGRQVLRRRQNQNRNRGFSLVELLVVIAVIGAITGIAIPFIGDTSEAARVARSKRNAQNLASMYTTGDTAGVDFLSAGDLSQTIQNVVTGQTVASGAFTGQFFGVSGMTADEQTNPAAYLELAHEMLVYKSDGS